MNSLHLFAGVGGGILADKILGNNIVGAVEIEPYCRKVLVQRQEEGYLEQFPIFEDVRTFNGDEITRRIDCICGGFPCQDISCAGKGKGLEGERSRLFYELIRICGHIRPDFIFLENSPAITGRGLNSVLREIAQIGYDAEWTTLSAGALGAPHQRNRWWALCKRQDVEPFQCVQECFAIETAWTRYDILSRRERSSSYSQSNGLRSGRQSGETEQTRTGTNATRLHDGSLDTGDRVLREGTCDNAECSANSGQLGTRNLPYSQNAQCEREDDISVSAQTGRTGLMHSCSNDGTATDSESSRLKENDASRTSTQISESSGDCGTLETGWWEVEPGMGRVANGVPDRVDRIKGLGNAQVPVVAAMAFYLLMKRFCE